MRPWSAFFGFITVLIVTTMALPDLFGFERIAQWGGMYTDNWCQGTFRVRPDPDASATEDRGFTVGNDPPIQTVWYAPQFTAKTCRDWAVNKCKSTWNGVEVVGAFAMWRGQWINGGDDLCSTKSASDTWFQP